MTEINDYLDYDYYEEKRHTKKVRFNDKDSFKNSKKHRKQKSRELQKFTDRLKKSY